MDDDSIEGWMMVRVARRRRRRRWFQFVEADDETATPDYNIEFNSIGIIYYSLHY